MDAPRPKLILALAAFLWLGLPDYVVLAQDNSAPLPAAVTGNNLPEDPLARLKMLGELAASDNKILLAVKYFTQCRDEAEKAGNMQAAAEASLKLVEAYCKASRTLSARNEHALILRNYAAFVRDNPPFADRLEFWNCRILVMEKKAGEALEKLKGMLQKVESGSFFHCEILDQMALAAVKNGDWKVAEGIYSELASLSEKISPEFSQRAKTSRTLCLFMIGDERALNEIPRQGASGEAIPQNARLVKLLVLVRGGSLGEAVAFFNEQKAIIPAEERHFWFFGVTELAKALRNAGQGPQAAKMFENARILSSGLGNSEGEDSSLALIDIYSSSGEKDKLLQSCEYFKRNFSDSSRIFDVMMLLARIYSEKLDVKNMQENYLLVIDHPSAPQDARMSAILELAERLLRCKEYAAARDIIGRYGSSLPEGSAQKLGSELILAEALFCEDRLDEAAKSFEKIYERSQPFPDTRRKSLSLLVKTLYRKADFASAARIAEKYLGEFKEKDDARREITLYLGDSKYELGDRASAVKIYRDFAAAYPDDAGAPEALVRAASVSIDAKDLASAEKILLDVIARYSKTDFHPVALYNLIFVHMLKGDEKAVEKVFDTLLEEIRGHRLFYPSVLAIVDFYRNRGEYGKAISIIDRVLEFSGESAPVEEKAPVPQEKATEKAVAKDGNGVQKKNGVKEEEGSNAQMLDRRQWVARLLYEKAFLQFSQDKSDDAIGTLDKLMTEFPGAKILPEAYYLQGDIYSEGNDFAKAVFAYDEAAKLRPESAIGYAALARSAECLFTTRTEEGNLKKALEINEKLIENGGALPSDFREHISYNLGRCLEESGRTDEALDKYLEIIYSYKVDSAEHKVRDPVWLVRAARAAAKIYRSKGNPDAYSSAAGIFRHLVDLEIEPVDEFKKEMNKYMDKLRLK